MSIPSMTSLAVARNLGVPTKSDAGVLNKDAEGAGEPPTLTQVLAKTVPVGLVTAYTAFIAVVSELVPEPSAEDPAPDQLLLIRWIALLAMVIFAAALTIINYKGKAGANARFPLLETSAVTVAAAAWGLGIPESPLLASVSENQGAILLALVAFLGVGINLVLSAMMKNQKT